MIDDAARQSPSDKIKPTAKSQSAAVTGVAVLSFVYGALYMLCGLGATVLGGVLGKALSADIRGQLMGGAAGLVAGFLILALGIPNFVAGYGVLKRRHWGRILTLVLAGLYGFLALSSAVNHDLGFVLSGPYFLFVFVVLLDRRYTAEFDASERATEGIPPSRLTSSVRAASQRKGYLVFLACAVTISLIAAAVLFWALFMHG
jgi:hypothetical protein